MRRLRPIALAFAMLFNHALYELLLTDGQPLYILRLYTLDHVEKVLEQAIRGEEVC
jgi:hypothetical protein